MTTRRAPGRASQSLAIATIRTIAPAPAKDAVSEPRSTTWTATARATTTAAATTGLAAACSAMADPTARVDSRRAAPAPTSATAPARAEADRSSMARCADRSSHPAARADPAAWADPISSMDHAAAAPARAPTFRLDTVRADSPRDPALRWMAALSARAMAAARWARMVAAPAMAKVRSSTDQRALPAIAWITTAADSMGPPMARAVASRGMTGPTISPRPRPRNDPSAATPIGLATETPTGPVRFAHG